MDRVPGLVITEALALNTANFSVQPLAEAAIKCCSKNLQVSRADEDAT